MIVPSAVRDKIGENTERRLACGCSPDRAHLDRRRRSHEPGLPPPRPTRGRRARRPRDPMHPGDGSRRPGRGRPYLRREPRLRGRRARQVGATRRRRAAADAGEAGRGAAPADDDRALPHPGGAGRRWDGRGVPRRAAPAGAAPRRAQGHQGGDGHPGLHPALRPGASRAGDDEPPEHRPGVRRRRDRDRPPLLRAGIRAGAAHHPLLRPASPVDRRAAAAVPAHLRGDPARAPQGDHPPRPQAFERAGDPGRRRQARAQGDRLRRGEGDPPQPGHRHAAHLARDDARHTRVHEPRAGRPRRAGRRHAHRRLLPRRAVVRAADRQPALRIEATAPRQPGRDAAHHPGGGPTDTEHPCEHLCGPTRGLDRDGRPQAEPAAAWRPRLDHTQGAREGPQPPLQHRARARRRHPPPPRRRTGARRAAPTDLPPRQVPAPLPRLGRCSLPSCCSRWSAA